uniref:Uncharacterized protein n=1 Tax=Anguilla anguilla TaxID=7936 RepID=A0A0E9RIV3_ANGAN
MWRNGVEGLDRTEFLYCHCTGVYNKIQAHCLGGAQIYKIKQGNKNIKDTKKE